MIESIRQGRIPLEMEKAKGEYTFCEKNLASIKQKCIETSEIMTHTMDLRDTSNLYEST